MKLSEEENSQVVSQLADALISSIGQDKIYKLSHEKMISEIVELMDDVEEKLDSLITERTEKLRPKKIGKNESYW